MSAGEASGQAIRFLADENFRMEIVSALRHKQPMLAILTVQEAGIRGSADPLVLAFAAEHGRILLTHDKRTVPNHLDALLVEGNHSPGVIYVPQDMPIGQAVEDLQLIAEASAPEEWRDLFSRLPL